MNYMIFRLQRYYNIPIYTYTIFSFTNTFYFSLNFKQTSDALPPHWMFGHHRTCYLSKTSGFYSSSSQAVELSHMSFSRDRISPPFLISVSSVRLVVICRCPDPIVISTGSIVHILTAGVLYVFFIFLSSSYYLRITFFPLIITKPL